MAAPRERRIPDAEQLDALRDAFRRTPPVTARDFRAAAKLAGVTEHAARTSWSRGFVGVEAIEQQLARERAIQAQSADLLKVERIVKLVTHNALNLQAELAQLQPVVTRLREDLVTDVVAKGLDLPAERSVALLDKLARIQARGVSVAQRAVELRRLVDGEATTIVGHKPLAPEPVDLDQARRTNELHARAIQRAAQLAGGTDAEGTEQVIATGRIQVDDVAN